MGLKLDPQGKDRLDYYFNIQKAMRYLGFFEEGQIYMEKYIETNKDGSVPIIQQSHYYSEVDINFTKAIEILEPLLYQDTTSAALCRTLGRNYFFLREFDKAYKYLEIYLNNPEDLEIPKFEERTRMAYLLIKKGLERAPKKMLE